MKKMHRTLALILSLLMLVSVMAACGEKSDSGSQSADNGGSGDADSVSGSVQTWGNLSVFVPDSMDFKGGDGSFNPDDENTAWLYDKQKATNYIKITILDNEENAKTNIETTREMNAEYNPIDASVEVEGVEWTGITYDASGTNCVMLYRVAGEKVYFIMMAGFEQGDEAFLAVLESLK